jgi:hypothetical protein
MNPVSRRRLRGRGPSRRFQSASPVSGAASATRRRADPTSLPDRPTASRPGHRQRDDRGQSVGRLRRPLNHERVVAPREGQRRLGRVGQQRRLGDLCRDCGQRERAVRRPGKDMQVDRAGRRRAAAPRQVLPWPRPRAVDRRPIDVQPGAQRPQALLAGFGNRPLGRQPRPAEQIIPNGAGQRSRAVSLHGCYFRTLRADEQSSQHWGSGAWVGWDPHPQSRQGH